MLADFYVRRLSNDMKIAVRKNNFWGQILYRSLDPVKKNGVTGRNTNPEGNPADAAYAKWAWDWIVRSIQSADEFDYLFVASRVSRFFCHFKYFILQFFAKSQTNFFYKNWDYFWLNKMSYQKIRVKDTKKCVKKFVLKLSC